MCGAPVIYPGPEPILRIREKNRMAKRAWVVLFMLSLAGCNWILPSSSSDDMKALQGTWTLVSATNNGAPMSADMQWMVDGDAYVRYNQQTDPTPVKITLSSHNRIDAVHHETPAGTYGGKFEFTS